MIVVVARSGRRDTRDHEDAVLRLAVAAGARVWLTGNLYHLADDCSLWADLAAQPGPLAVAAWLHPRPCQALLTRHGAWPAESRAADLGAGDPAWVVSELHLAATDGAGTVVERDESAARERWYPVLDRDRCTDCGHCQQFCIFGVYATDAQGRVQVVQPDACKSGCPACARVCPQGAVLFPLHREPAIAGAPGHLMELDLFGRQLFYNRTQQPCPRCGLAARKDPRGGGPPCPVCGRSRDEQPSRRDALDSLIDDLDRLEARR